MPIAIMSGENYASTAGNMLNKCLMKRGPKFIETTTARQLAAKAIQEASAA